MDGYLGQIANRTITSRPAEGIMPPGDSSVFPKKELYDPFEQSAISQNDLQFSPSALSINNTSMKVEEALSPSPKEDQEAAIRPVTKEINYLTRHITRIQEGETRYRETPVHSTKNVHEVVHSYEQRPISQPFEEKRKSQASAVVQENANKQSISKPLITGEIKPVTLKDKPVARTPVLLPSVLPEQPKPVEKKKTSQPKLSIGRITVEVVSPAKQPVVQKVERRTVIQRGEQNTVRDKFIFGLGQL